LESSALKLETVGCPETSVENYNYLLRNNPEDRNSHPLRDGSLKSSKLTLHLLALEEGLNRSRKF